MRAYLDVVVFEVKDHHALVALVQGNVGRRTLALLRGVDCGASVHLLENGVLCWRLVGLAVSRLSHLSDLGLGSLC